MEVATKNVLLVTKVMTDNNREWYYSNSTVRYVMFAITNDTLAVTQKGCLDYLIMTLYTWCQDHYSHNLTRRESKTAPLMEDVFGPPVWAYEI